MDHAIVGFELLGDPVLGGEFVPFQDGLSVLYGLNGAGKTRLLTGMRNAILGVGSPIRVGLMVRAQEPTEADIASDNSGRQYAGQDERCSGAGFLLALAGRLGGPQDHDRRSAGSDGKTMSLTAAFRIVQDHLRDELAPWTIHGDVGINADELESELLRDRLFLMFPDGTSGAAGWQVWPVADRRGVAVSNWERRWAAVDDQSLNDQERFDLEDHLNEVALGPGARHGASRSWGFWVDTRSKGRLVSSSFVFYGSSGFIPSETPPIIITGPIDFGVDLVNADQDPEVLTLDLLSRTVMAGDSSSYRPDEVQTSNAVKAGERALDAIASELTREVNDFMTKALRDPPTASIQFTPTLFRFSMPAAHWGFRNSLGAPAVDLAWLSTAERKWASLAILFAVGQLEQRARFHDTALLRRTLLLFDEPESGLHRAAEARAAGFLQLWATDPTHVAVVATHSPELLDLPDASLIEIAKDGSTTPTSLVRRLDLADRDALTRLGLRPSDLLRWPKVFLLVEGLHDVLVLEGYFGDRLRAARIEILPLRGATKLPNTVDSRVLFTFTDAIVVALLDNISSDSVRECWERAQSARMLDGVEAAKQIVLSGIADQSEESRFLREWLTNALDSGLESRLMPIGLSARDIIEYLPVSSMAPGVSSWEALRCEHQEDRESATGTPGDFKKWLGIRKRIDVTESLIQIAFESAPAVPLELERLMKTLEAVSSQARSNKRF